MRKLFLASLALILGVFSVSAFAQAPRLNFNSTAMVTVQPSGDGAVLIRLVSGTTNNVSFQAMDGMNGKVLGQIDASGSNDGKAQMIQVKTIVKASVGQEIVLRLREQGVPGGIRIRLTVGTSPRNLMIQRQGEPAMLGNDITPQPMNDKCHGYVVLSDDCVLSANCKGEPLFNLVTCTVVECEQC